ncbi:MAG: hypothetical protein PHI40_06775 [Caldisericia bacterium]|nr:hypothetical protein [Caldisericia bacterium]
MRWYLNQTVSLCKFGVIERVFFAACQTNCFAGEAFAAYDPCGNMISLIDKVTATEVWSRAVDKNSDSTIWIYNPYAMEIPISAQATIHPSYDQPINGPIEIQIPEQGQWDLKEYFANMTKASTTIGENGVDVTINGGDDCTAGEGDCENEGCSVDDCESIFKSQDSADTKYNNYEADEYNCKLITCCAVMYFCSAGLGGKEESSGNNIQLVDQQYYNTAGESGTSTNMPVQLFEDRKSKLWEWVNNNEKACNEYGIDRSDYSFGGPNGI